MSEETIALILRRLRSDAILIDRMLRDDHRQRYFEALRTKKTNPSLANVTAAFFHDG